MEWSTLTKDSHLENGTYLIAYSDNCFDGSYYFELAYWFNKGDVINDNTVAWNKRREIQQYRRLTMDEMMSYIIGDFGIRTIEESGFYYCELDSQRYEWNKIPTNNIDVIFFHKLNEDDAKGLFKDKNMFDIGVAALRS